MLCLFNGSKQLLNHGVKQLVLIHPALPVFAGDVARLLLAGLLHSGVLRRSRPDWVATQGISGDLLLPRKALDLQPVAMRRDRMFQGEVKHTLPKHGN